MNAKIKYYFYLSLGVSLLFNTNQKAVAGAPVTYDFESMNINNNTFVSSGETFSVVPELIGINFLTYGSDINGNELTSDYYLDTGFQSASSGEVGGIVAPSGMTFKALGFDVWPSANQGGAVLPAPTSVKVLGTLANSQTITATVQTVDYGQNTPEDVRWHRISLIGTDFDSSDITEVKFELIGSQNYIAVDNFVYTDLQISNQLPEINGATAGQTVDDDQSILPFQNITLSEPDGANISISVSLDDNAKGVFTPTSLMASGFTGSGPYNLTSTSAVAAQNAIRLLDYNPTDDRVAPGQTETTIFTIAANDGIASATNSTTTVISTSIDQPPVAMADAFTVLEDAAITNLDVLGNDTDVDGGPHEIQAISQSLNGTVSNNISDVSYQPDADYCYDGQTTDNFTYATNGPSGAVVAVTVTCINDQPTISVMGDVDATGLVDEQNTEIQVEGFVDSIVFGPVNESNQGVLGFFPNCANDPNDIIDTIIVDTQGELTIDFNLNLGVAICQLTMLDNGGTQNNGENTSNTIEFTVSLTDLIFANGFEDVSEQLIMDKLQMKAMNLGLLSFDRATNTFYLAGRSLQLQQGSSLKSQLTKVNQWIYTLMNE